MSHALWHKQPIINDTTTYNFFVFFYKEADALWMGPYR